MTRPFCAAFHAYPDTRNDTSPADLPITRPSAGPGDSINLAAALAVRAAAGELRVGVVPHAAVAAGAPAGDGRVTVDRAVPGRGRGDAAVLGRGDGHGRAGVLGQERGQV